jgi:hypothetical protein
MSKFHSFKIAVSGLLLLASSLGASDLSKYREFQLDSDLPELARQAGMKPGEAKVIHERPAAIQELSWRAEPGDSVEEILFGFYNGELFRMVVGYDGYGSEGLTAQDMIKAISATYGVASHPDEVITLPSIYDDSEIVEVMARWEDSNWSFNLVQSKYQPNFMLVALSKRLNAQARVAVDEALRLDIQEAPRKEIERRNKELEEKRLQLEKAREANRPDFRP